MAASLPGHEAIGPGRTNQRVRGFDSGDRVRDSVLTFLSMERATHLPKRRYPTGFSLIELMIVVAILGLLAAVAIPSLMLMVRRSKTSEATVNLRRIFDGALTNYQADIVSRGGAPEAARFAESVPATPGVNACCAQVGGKCMPASDTFDHLTWQKLQFSVDDPHYYWYEFVSAGAGRTAEFTARVQGNLNCDDTYSTFERVGFVDLIGGVSGGGGISKIRPNE